ncbi:hypothetical protein [Nocardia goodfellowii]|uniref:Uncharacterized protein n=1 Tax=Nocardia goodfellowii TaxID=882446 RepID=A0ABS4QML2_9NOCA|nr:hypothetical protein [Nocardia goodfellowii]MBP2192940.1 hypothetical protein [Nocardia goodfellowii]
MKVDHVQQRSRFAPTARWLRDLIIERNAQGRPNMLFAGQSVSEEGAHLAYTLSLVHTPGTGVGDCVSFLANSTEEGISAAVKLARHTAARDDRSGQILFIDPEQSLVQYFDPARAGLADALVPGVQSTDSVKAAFDVLATESWAAVLIVLSDEFDGLSDEVEDLLRRASADGAMRIVCDRLPIPAAIGDRRLPAAAIDADVWVYGENLTDHQVPFGCSVMTRRAYTVWNNPVDCLAHSSTFGGNGIAATAALHVLRERGYLDDRAERVLADIVASRRARNAAFARHMAAKIESRIPSSSRWCSGCRSSRSPSRFELRRLRSTRPFSTWCPSARLSVWSSRYFNPVRAARFSVSGSTGQFRHTWRC